MSLVKQPKQPNEIRDYDIETVDFLRQGETVVSTAPAVACLSTPADSSLAVSGVTISTGLLRVRCTGGTNLKDYKVTISFTTSSGRIHEYDFIVKVRES